MYEAKLELPDGWWGGGGGVSETILFLRVGGARGRVWLFSETTQ